LLEGPNVIGPALDAGCAIGSFFGLEEDEMMQRAAAAGASVAVVSQPVMDKLAGTDSPRGPVAVAVQPAAAELEPADTIVLCAVKDPGNAGTLIRSAAAFGFQVAATAKTVDLWNPKVLRSAAGAHFVVRMTSHADLPEIQAAGIHPVALIAHDDGTPDPGPSMRPIGLLVGNEARGLSKKLVGSAEATLTVPTSGAVESLNAAVAGSIAMFAIAQVRK